MLDAKAVLKKWAFDFVKSRDAFFRKIAKIDDGPENFTVFYKDGREQPHLILPTLGEVAPLLSSIGKDKPLAIVTLNNRANRQKLADIWKSVADFKLLTIYFSNPFSNGEKKWVLMPHVHNKICDGNLATGFNSLSELVEDISEEEAKARSS
jgi:hypothetical protein